MGGLLLINGIDEEWEETNGMESERRGDGSQGMRDAKRRS
jgi:hypothetical protein